MRLIDYCSDKIHRFLESEALLDERIQTFAALAEFPRLFGLAAKLQLFKLLATSIAHDNADIACDAIDVVRELTDEDVECSEQEASEIADAIVRFKAQHFFATAFRSYSITASALALALSLMPRLAYYYYAFYIWKTFVSCC